jgi:primosomal protein N' (replication factor Y)
MIAKGFDFPHLTTLGIVQADAGLSLPDFSSSERTFQLLTQVIGRANRGHQNSQVFIQTYQPDHPSIKFGYEADYQSFYRHLIKARQTSNLPPYTYLLKLTLTYKTESTCLKNIKQLRKKLINPSLSISQPTPAFHENTKKGITWQLIIKSKSRAKLINILKTLPKNPHLQTHIDPPTLL